MKLKSTLIAFFTLLSAQIVHAAPTRLAEIVQINAAGSFPSDVVQITYKIKCNERMTGVWMTHPRLDYQGIAVTVNQIADTCYTDIPAVSYATVTLAVYNALPSAYFAAPSLVGAYPFRGVAIDQYK